MNLALKHTSPAVNSSPWTPPGLPPSGEPKLPDGMRIGPYRLVRNLGRGTAADVFEATDVCWGRVVVKLARPAPGGGWVPLDREVWCEQQQRQGRLVSRHIVQVLDSGTVQNGRPYVVMEHRAGRSLQQRLSHGRRLSEAEVVRLARQLFRALGDLHRFGVVHRDLKPANIQVGPDGHLTLLDLGLVTPVGDTSGDTVGTPVSMAPEQWGMPRPISAATDLYAAGCLLFRMLTGRWPYPIAGKGPQRIMAAMRSHVTEPVADPLAVSPGCCSRGLADLVMWLMAKEPSERPDDAQLVEVLLRRVPKPQTAAVDGPMARVIPLTSAPAASAVRPEDSGAMVEVAPSMWRFLAPSA